eukprot:COSAG02_NODE_7194_length_3126_cov_6.047572_2_plen_84_part_00
MSQFQTLQFSMTLDRWRRERERDQLYAGADGGLRPLPLGRGIATTTSVATVSELCASLNMTTTVASIATRTRSTRKASVRASQ